MTYVTRSLPGLDQAQSVLSGDYVRYENLQYRHDEQDRAFWCYLNPIGRPSFTQGLLADLHSVQERIRVLVSPAASLPNTVGWVVLGSRSPGIFSLGGDLTHFATKIAEGDRAGLTQYAYDCVEVAYQNATGYGGGAISIGLAQGEALGGGFESLLSCDVLVAERQARFGLPEVLMNLFPGMGAHCFLTRRVGSAAAMRMILSGEVVSAETLHTMGIVDVLAEDGQGEEVVQAYILRNQSRHKAHSAAYRARRRVSPVSLEELHDVCDVWVDTAMELTSSDLRRMSHLVSAQDRRRRRTAEAVGVAAE